MELLEQTWASDNELAKKEAGDCLWYSFALARSLKIELDLDHSTEFVEGQPAEQALMLSLGALSGSVKKMSRGACIRDRGAMPMRNVVPNGEGGVG